MNRIIITRGLPASGKTTFAKELLVKEPGQWKRVNKDDLRAMLDGGKWSKGNEKFVIEERNGLIIDALLSGYSVIVDDTNLNPRHIVEIGALIEIFNEKAEKVSIEVKDFTHISLEECIKRDQKRPGYVGERVIRDMYNRYLKPKIVPVQWNTALPTSIICDLDGTLALFGDANPYDRDFLKDEVNEPVQEILANFATSTRFLLVSGRVDKFRDQTEQWLHNQGIYYHELFMRKDGDTRKDSIVKQEIYEKEIKGKYNVLFVLDDRNQVVDFWRSQGLTCLQVAPGDF